MSQTKRAAKKSKGRAVKTVTSSPNGSTDEASTDVNDAKSQPEDEIRAFYAHVGQWLKGDVPKSEAAFAYFTCRCQPGFVAVGPTAGGPEARGWDEWEAPSSTNYKTFLDNLFKRHGVFAAKTLRFTVSDFELVTSKSPRASGVDRTDSALSRGRSDEVLDEIDGGHPFLVSCTYILYEETDDGAFRKRATCTICHHPAGSSSSSTSSGSIVDQWILLHESWIDNPEIIRLEEDLTARREQRTKDILRRTSRALKREKLTLAALRFQSGGGFDGEMGIHKVVKGSVIKRANFDKSEETETGAYAVDTVSQTSDDEDEEQSKSPRESRAQSGASGSDSSDDEDSTNEDRMMTNTWLVRYERMREEIERRTALVDPLHFVRAYTRHLVLLVAHMQQIPVVQMFRYPGALLPNTWNRRLLQNQQLAVIHVFGSLRNFFESRPVKMLLEVRDNIIYLRDDLTQETVEEAIEAM